MPSGKSVAPLKANRAEHHPHQMGTTKKPIAAIVVLSECSQLTNWPVDFQNQIQQLPPVYGYDQGQTLCTLFKPDILFLEQNTRHPEQFQQFSQKLSLQGIQVVGFTTEQSFSPDRNSDLCLPSLSPELIKSQLQSYVYAQSGNQTGQILNCGRELVSSEEICYIQAHHVYTQLVLKDRKILLRRSLKELLGQLDASFLQVHKSFVVNSTHISKISREVVWISEFKVPIGRAYRGALKAV